MSRNEHFHESAGNPIVGYDTGEEAICSDCAKNDPEYALVDPKKTSPIRLSNVGEGSQSSYPDGFTCPSCSTSIGSWDYKGGR
jgi:hypothetical protein